MAPTPRGPPRAETGPVSGGPATTGPPGLFGPPGVLGALDPPGLLDLPCSPDPLRTRWSTRRGWVHQAPCGPRARRQPGALPGLSTGNAILGLPGPVTLCPCDAVQELGGVVRSGMAPRQLPEALVVVRLQQVDEFVQHHGLKNP